MGDVVSSSHIAMPRDDEESVLVGRAREGDRGAFSRLAELHEDYVYELCCRIAGNREDGEDLAQDTMLRAYRAVRQFRGEASFRTWLYRIAVNLCLSFTARRPPVPLSVEEADSEMPSAIGQPEESAIKREFLVNVQHSFSDLSMEQRAILVLRDVQDLSYEEIAAVLGCPVGTVRSRLSRARLALRTRLRERELFGANGV